MTQSLWEPEAAPEAVEDHQPEEDLFPDQELLSEEDPQDELEPFEPHSEETAQVQAEVETQSAEPEILAVTADEFSALEDRILRAVSLVKRERVARAEAEAHVAQLESQLQEQTPQVDRLQAEVHTLRSERDQVRQRVERLLTQLDALEL